MSSNCLKPGNVSIEDCFAKRFFSLQVLSPMSIKSHNHSNRKWVKLGNSVQSYNLCSTRPVKSLGHCIKHNDFSRHPVIHAKQFEESELLKWS